MSQIHATAVTIDGTGVLLTGPSGSGKSDLALRLIGRGARLVADDRCEIFVTGGQLNSAPPAALEGMMEIRGIGIVVLPFDNSARIALVCDLADENKIKRLPDTEMTTIKQVRLPLFRVAPFEASAPEKVQLALRLVTGKIGSVA